MTKLSLPHTHNFHGGGVLIHVALRLLIMSSHGNYDTKEERQRGRLRTSDGGQGANYEPG